MKTFDTETLPATLEQYLGDMGWLQSGETVEALSKAGEGNMNVVVRVTTDQRSFILKQSRPYVQKYPQIPAPLDRIRVEHRFYQAVRGAGIDRHLPRILGFDPENSLMLQEDLGHARDMSYLYETRELEPETLRLLTEVLVRIHATPVPEDFPANLELRGLNHQHIFVLPFDADNGFDLDSVQAGLAQLALPFKTDKALKSRIEAVGKRYLSEGNVLLHGDYYPGSWLRARGGTYIIDPEFCFAGFPEYDLGVMAGHLLMASMDTVIVDEIFKHYPRPFDRGLVRQMAGIEILRRLIGLAQLPLKRSLDEKRQLITLAKNMILDEA